MAPNVIFLILMSLVTAFKRDLQSRFDALEERYDRDYMLMKADMRDLWVAFDHVSSKCCHEPGAPASKPLPVSKDSSITERQVTEHNANYSNNFLLKAFSHEKAFLRQQLGKTADLVRDTANICNGSIQSLGKQMLQIEAFVQVLEAQNIKLTEHQKQMVADFESERLITQTTLENLKLVLEETLKKEKDENVLYRPSSCMDLVRGGVKASGVYTLYVGLQSFTAFCLIRNDGGYTFIYPETLITVNISVLSNDNSHVLIRHRRTNGEQYESRIDQITRYAFRPISVQYNAHTGYQGPINSLMTPYLYVGLTPITLEHGRQHKGDTQGYRSNGKDITFINCDGNPNGYFAFLFNHNGVSPGKWYSPDLARQWVDSAVKVSDLPVPDKFLSFFELHFGGCGVFASTDRISGVTGAAVGIPFKL